MNHPDFSGILARLLKRAANIFDSPDPLMVMPYRGYATDEAFFLQGRVLENEGIFDGKSDHELRNLLDSWKRIETDEIAGARVAIRIGGQNFQTVTDKEGYFTLEAAWNGPPSPIQNRWLPASVQLIAVPEGPLPEALEYPAEVFLPSKNANCGIITDVDDTVLQTHVTSRLKLKTLYVTLFKDSHQRLPLEGIPELLQALEKGDDQKRENPVFYVSNSPWNLYDLLQEFMAINRFPKGPILLRDYGLHMLRKKKNDPGHKIKTIRKLLDMYPALPFILMGDSTQHDTDYFLQIAREFDSRIAAIYIRKAKDTRNARRIEQLIEQNSNINAVIVNSSQEIYDHALAAGYII